MENQTVKQLLAMSDEEVSKLTPQEKANRTKTINAAKPATPQSGELANGVINAAAAQTNAATGASPETLKKEQEDKAKAEEEAKKREAAKKEKDEAAAAEKKKSDELAAQLKAEQDEADAAKAESEAAKAEEEDKKNLGKYGLGYIKATNGGRSTIFSATAWALLGNNKEGWVPEVKEPAEVTNFKNKGGI